MELKIASQSKIIEDYKFALDQSCIVAITDKRGVIIHVNDYFCEISKYSREELLGQDHRIINSGHHPKSFFSDLYDTITSGKIWKGEIKNKAKDGKYYWVDTTIIPFLDDDGKPHQYLAIRSDITKRKVAEAQLEKTQSFLEASIESYQDMSFCVMDTNYRYVHFNSAFKNACKYAYGKDIEKGMSYTDIVDNEGDGRKIKESLDRCLNGERYTNLETYGEINKAYYETIFNPVTNDKNEIIGVTVLVSNVTEKVMAGEKNRQAKYFFDMNNDLACVANVHGFFELINPNFQKILGFSEKELLENSFLSFVHPEDVEATLLEMDKLKEGIAAINFVNRYRKQDGQFIWLEWNTTPDPISGKLYAIARDITARKKMEEQLVDSIKELEAFSYSVAHDLRTPLRSLYGYADVLCQEYSHVLDDEAKRMLDSIKWNSSKMGHLIDDLLALSRLGRKEINLETVNLKKLVKDAIVEINKNTPHRAEIMVDELHDVLGDYSLLMQLMINLLSNAIKYSSKVANPTIQISSSILNGEVTVMVKDNGAGFDMKYASKLFEVFQRLHTQHEFEGTGVGLAIVNRIITKHGGKIWAKGVVDGGATFYITLTPAIKN